MAVTFRSKSAAVNTSGTSPTPTEPAGAVSGDYVVALYATDTNGGNPNLPAGWATLYGRTTVGSAFQFIVGGIQRSGSAPSYAFTHTGSIYRELHVLCFQGAAAIALDSQSATGATGAATNHNPDASATTAVQSASLAVVLGINWGGSGAGGWGTTSPAGYALQSDNSVGNDCCISTKSLAASGSENPGAFTGVVAAGSQSYWDGAVITLEDITLAGGGASIVPILMRQYRQRKS